MNFKQIAVALIVVGFVVPATDPASAHARLKSAVPAAGSSIKPGLAEISLKFNEAVEPALSIIELLDADGKTIASSKGKTVCAETACNFPVDPLKTGTYAVRYHILSEDGHVVEATYSFEVAE